MTGRTARVRTRAPHCTTRTNAGVALARSSPGRYGGWVMPARAPLVRLRAFVAVLFIAVSYAVVAYLDSLLRADGLSCGSFTSPHILRFNERIWINGRPAGDATILAAFERVEAARAGVSLTYFEFTTLAILLVAGCGSEIGTPSCDSAPSTANPIASRASQGMPRSSESMRLS